MFCVACWVFMNLFTRPASACSFQERNYILTVSEGHPTAVAVSLSFFVFSLDGSMFTLHIAHVAFEGWG